MPTQPAPAALGDEPALFTEIHPRLRDHVRLRVRTSRANVEDACSFAFLQLLRYQPDREHLYGWLLRTATREAIKLDQRARRTSPSRLVVTRTAARNRPTSGRARSSSSSCSPPVKPSPRPG
jgi:DNA-directed RNA polymerase specialized sigma24 family protein